MKIENQVCTLEQAKRLKELGITKISENNEDESGFYYVNDDSLQFYSREDGFPSMSCKAAFTVAELGIMLGILLEFVHRLTDTYVWYWNTTITDGIDYKHEAEARAALLIYLLETNVISPDEVNERLKNS